VRDGAFEVTVQPGRVYTFSTLHGHRAVTSPPASAPMDYFGQSFNGFPLDKSPKWFSDMEGAFETATCPTGTALAAGADAKPQGKCLRQVITQRPNVWMRTPYPITLLQAGHLAPRHTVLRR